jgi:hypothetical protein
VRDVAAFEARRAGACVLIRFCQPADASKYTANTSAVKITKKTGGSRTVIVNLASSVAQRGGQTTRRLQCGANQLLVFGPAGAPSEDSGPCLLTKFGFG